MSNIRPIASVPSGDKVISCVTCKMAPQNEVHVLMSDPLHNKIDVIIIMMIIIIILYSVIKYTI